MGATPSVGSRFATQPVGVLNALFAEYFPDSPPVRSTPVIALPRGLLFSIDAIAVTDAATHR